MALLFQPSRSRPPSPGDPPSSFPEPEVPGTPPLTAAGPFSSRDRHVGSPGKFPFPPPPPSPTLPAVPKTRPRGDATPGGGSAADHKRAGRKGPPRPQLLCLWGARWLQKERGAAVRKVRPGGTEWVPEAREAVEARCLRVPRLTSAACTPGQRGCRHPAAPWRLAVGSASHTASGGFADVRAAPGDPWPAHLGQQTARLGERGRCQGACQPVEKRCQGGGEGRAGGGASAAAPCEGGSRSPGS